MPRSIETVVGYYDKFTNDSRDVAYAVVLLKRADELLRNAEESGQIPTDLRNPAAVALAKLGASKGGSTTAQRLTPEERSKSASRAANARWHPKDS